MTYTHTTARLHGVRSDAGRANYSRRAWNFAKLFVDGPRQLVTHEITAKCAAMMISLCSPALLLCSLLTLPALLFNSPQHNAYFYFARVLEGDPMRWLVLALSSACALLALVVPATMPARRDARGDWP